MGLAAAIAGASIVGAVSSNVASNRASSASDRASSTAATLTREGTAQARSDLLSLFPDAIQSGQQGFQAAANVFRDVVPQQSDIFQRGNINAQNTLLAGLPQQQNAILGGNVNFGALQPTTQFQPDFSFLNQQIMPLPQADNIAPFAPDNAVVMGPSKPQQFGRYNGISERNFRLF